MHSPPPSADTTPSLTAGAWPQARHDFLQGNGLPERWQTRSRFVILETGFGQGNNFLSTWAAWRADPRRCERLVFIAIEKSPLSQCDLQGAHRDRRRDDDSASIERLSGRLCDAWPSLTPGMHVLDFDEPVLDVAMPHAGVTLLLALGDVATMVPALVAAVDAFYLDGFAPSKKPGLWDAHLLRRLNRLAAPGATVSTWNDTQGVRDALSHAGFAVERLPGLGDTRGMTRARYEPRYTPPPLPGGIWPEPADQRHAVVIGAGLAGCAAAWALTREGWRVTLLDRHAQPAQEASGNPGGLFHSIVHAQDGLHARTHRAAALLTSSLAGPWIRDGRIRGQCAGLLRLAENIGDIEAPQLLAKLGLPSEHVEWKPRDDAQALCGLAVPSGGWLFKEGGWLHPAGYAQALMEEAAKTGLLHWRGLSLAQRLARSAQGLWQVLSADGAVLAEAGSVVLANAGNASALAASTGLAAELPLSPSRGQITTLASSLIGVRTPALPVAGGGYALTLPDGTLLCGATSQADDVDPSMRQADHGHNMEQASRLGALDHVPALTELPEQSISGRVGWRAATPDRLPLVGALPLRAPEGHLDSAWPDQVRRVPRLRDAQGGLFVLSGLGSRGITWAALGARLLSHWVTGAPCPVEADLRDALDPARFGVRQQRLQTKSITGQG